MNKSVTAIVLRSEDYNDYDKKIKLFTEEGEVIRVIIRGVKRSTAKLRFAAQPFAFCNYELSERNGFYSVIKAAAIEDLRISDYEVFVSGCVMLEAAERACEYQPNSELFVLLLKRLKTLIYGGLDPKLSAISFLQNAIHKSGYSYKYDPPKPNPETVMELLACTEELATDFTASGELINKTFDKIAANFEDKFSCSLRSFRH